MSRKVGPIIINLATKNFVDKAHERNQTVAYWTINDLEEMRLLIEIGADIITTDSPDLLKEELCI